MLDAALYTFCACVCVTCRFMLDVTGLIVQHKGITSLPRSAVILQWFYPPKVLWHRSRECIQLLIRRSECVRLEHIVLSTIKVWHDINKLGYTWLQWLPGLIRCRAIGALYQCHSIITQYLARWSQTSPDSSELRVGWTTIISLKTRSNRSPYYKSVIPDFIVRTASGAARYFRLFMILIYTANKFFYCLQYFVCM